MAGRHLGGELLKKAVFFWMISVVLVVAAVFGLLLSGGDGILGILFLVLLFLALSALWVALCLFVSTLL